MEANEFEALQMEATNMTMSEPVDDAITVGDENLNDYSDPTKPTFPVMSNPTPDVDELEEEITVSPEEIIDAFEAVYEELVMLRNSVINLHERLEALEKPSNVSI